MGFRRLGLLKVDGDLENNGNTMNFEGNALKTVMIVCTWQLALTGMLLAWRTSLSDWNIAPISWYLVM
jgi:hypothetical protein